MVPGVSAVRIGYADGDHALVCSYCTVSLCERRKALCF